ncbi:MAG: glycosyltransferase family 2 protein [Lachnospiraceae bacterium]|nr:glycosyltransferase family 2 protein [Lachnospiraceae bacterium]
MGDITVIIPVFNPGESLKTLIHKLLSQTIVPYKIILLWTVPETSSINECDSDYKRMLEHISTIDNIDIVHDLDMTSKISVEYIMQREFDHGGTRNHGMSLVQTDYAVCMTQDAVPYDNSLFENLMNAFADERVAAAYARQLPRDNAGYIERITREFNYPDKDRIQNSDTLNELGIKTYFCSDVCAMYSVKRYNESGEFVKKTIFNEDMLMAAALIENGYSVKYVADAKVIHSHAYSYMEQYRRNFDLAVSHVQYSYVFDKVPSEGEGIKLVLTTCKRLIKSGRIYLIPDLVLQSAFKYLGYRAGKRYKSLSTKKIMKKTMNKLYWTGVE